MEKTDEDEVDRPRKLSYGEIQSVLVMLKELPSPFAKAAKVARANLLDHIGTALQEIEVCPSAIEDLRNRILSSQIRNICEPGYAMGSTTGSALGSINTQTMLNTFKASGAADTGSREVQATENLVYARASPKTDYCTLHFLDKRAGMYKALSSTYDVDQFTVRDALVKNEVDYVIHSLPMDDEQPDWFWCSQTKTFQELLYKASCIMELILDPEQLAVRDISMSEVVMALQKNSMNVVWSSLSEGRIFVLPSMGEYVNEEQLADKNLLTCFMVMVFYENLNNIFLKGIPGQSNSEPCKDSNVCQSVYQGGRRRHRLPRHRHAKRAVRGVWGKSV